MKTPCLLIVLLCVLIAAHALYYAPQLPDPVACHFASGGEPNGWQSRSAFLGLYLGIVALLAALFAGLPLGLSRIPPFAVSLPYREHWMAPEQRPATIRYLQAWIAWYGVATLLLMTLLNHVVIQANLLKPPRLDDKNFLLGLGIYFAFLLAWVIALFRRFRRPGAA